MNALETGLTDRHSLRRELLLCWVHLSVLWSFAIAGPLFDVLSDSPDFFVARGNTRGDILVFAFALVLVPPTLALLVELAVARFDRVRRLVHLVFVGALVAALALQVLDDLLGGSSAVLIPLSLVLGAAAAIAYARGRVAGSILTVLSPAPVLFLVVFLVFSPVSKLVLPQDEGDVATAAISRPTPVVMLVLDEFRLPTLMDSQRQIDAVRFPNFAALARDFTWYRNATTVADQTTRAVPAILTGRVPRAGELPIIADHPRNLFTMLARSYSMNVREAATQLCPDSVCETSTPAAARRLRSLAKDLTIVSLHRLLPDDLERDLPAVDQTFGDFGDTQIDTDASGEDQASDRPGPELAAGRRAEVENWVRSLGPKPGKPTLDFLHVFLPHIPWMYLPSGRVYADNGVGLPGLDREIKGWGKGGWSDNRWLTEQAEQRFTLQALFVDSLIGELVARLRRTGLYDRALVIVTSDHGVSFRPGQPRRAVRRANIGDIAGVPLFVKLPRQRRGGVDDASARTVDLLPTVADVLGMRVSSDLDGRSLLDRARPDSSTVSVAQADGRRVSISLEQFVRVRDQAARRTRLLLGSGDPRKIYRVGPAPDLVGRPLNALNVGGSSRGRVLLDGAQQFASINPVADVLPAYVTGRLEGVAPNASLAVAVNGWIRAVGSAFERNGSMRLGTLVPEDALRRGRNAIRVFEIQRGVDGTRLLPLRQAATETYRLAHRDGADVLVAPSGEESRVVATRGGGFLEDVKLEHGGLAASGWSASASRGAASKIVAFVNGRLVAETVPGTDRPDVARLFGEAATRSGFYLNAQVPASAAGRSPDLRVFGIFGREAVELQN